MPRGKSSNTESKWTGDRRSPESMAVEKNKATRVRVPRELPEPADGTTAWSKKRSELRGFNAGRQAASVFDHPAADALKSHLLQKDSRRRRDLQYSGVELERCELARRAAGVTDNQMWVTLLEAPKLTPVRRALDFDRSRNPAYRQARMRNSLDGVPSTGTLSRHRSEWTNPEFRAMYWEGLARDLLEAVLDVPEVAAELRSINLDGFLVPIPYTAPAYDINADGIVTVANADYVTSSEAGVLPRDSHGRGEHGFSMVSAWTSTGIPLCWDTGRNSDSEKLRGPALVRDQLASILEPHLKSRKILGILTTDGNFHSNAMREACRDAALVENVHIVSHVNRDRARDFDTRWLPFQGYEKWGTNGHHEVVCWCGAGRRTKIFETRDDGTAVCRVEARCPACGYICVTSGEWVYDTQLKAWVYRDPSSRAERPDLSVGNGLTFNDPLAERYGKLRFSHHEGNHGALVTRWKLGFGKRYFRTLAELRVEIAMVMCAIYISILEYHAVASGSAELPLAA